MNPNTKKSKRCGHEPFFRADRNKWYVHRNGRTLVLHSDKDEAWTKWHALKAQPAPTPQPGKCLTIADLADAYRLHAELYYRKDGQPTSEAWIATDLWHLKKVNPQSMVHLTEKPVELAARAIQYSSREGENVLDLFAGSGSTLIACEQTGRSAYLMELDPLYCDVIVQRWENLTGKKAERPCSPIERDSRKRPQPEPQSNRS